MAQMNDKERYIYGYLNSKSTTLSFYVPKILDSSIVGREKQAYIKRVCVLVEDIKGIIDALGVQSVPVNGFFNELYLLRNANIPVIDELLASYNYAQVLQSGYVEILRSMSLRNNLDADQKMCAEFLIENHLVENETEVFEYFISGILLKTSELSYDAFCVLLTDYVKLRMKEYIANPKCYIVSSSELKNIKEATFKDTIYLSREGVQKLYHTGTYKVLKDMLHDLAHVKQYQEIVVDKKSGKGNVRQIKDSIITDTIPNYHENNNERLSYEIEAEVFAINELLVLFDKFGITFKYGKNPYYQTLLDLVKAASSSERIIDGRAEDIDDVFDYTIMHHPDYLIVYPQLQEEYEIGYANLVVRKNLGRKD